MISHAKSIDAVASGLGIDSEGGADLMQEIEEVLRKREA